MGALRESVKHALLRVAPAAAGRMQIAWQRRHMRRLQNRLGLPRLTREYVTRFGYTVRRGPFAGMRYIDHAAGSTLIPKLIGCYELELHGAIDEAIVTGYDVAVDVGSAEGYYAVGLAMRMPRAMVYAYDIDPSARRLCRRLAQANGVAARIELRGHCHPSELQSVLSGRSLVLCDCEGFEAELLDPVQTPALKCADILVELHEAARPGVTELLVGRFRSTHSVGVIPQQARLAAHYAEAAQLSRPDDAVSEVRGSPQSWLWMRAMAAK